MSSETHHRLAADTPVRCGVITVSDSRTEQTDGSGRYIREALREAGHPLASYQIVRDDAIEIVEAIGLTCSECDAILINGGTGISRRDTTFEALTNLLEKQLPGFGEIFRMLSFEDIGPAAMLSRATAGVYCDTVIFSMPGSTGAVRLAMDRLILPELRHLVWELIRQQR